MSSEILGSAENVLKGNLGGAWDVKHGYADAYTDLGIARRFGGSAAAYSLRDVGAMNGRVVKVRREQDTTPVDFSAGAIANGAVEQFAIGQSVLNKYNDAAYFPADSAYFSVTNIDLTGAFTITVSFIYTGDEDKDQMTLFFGNAGKDTITFTDYSTFRFRRDADNKSITLDSDIKKNTLHTLVVTRDSSDVVSVSIDGVTQSNTITEAGTYKIERMGFRNRGTQFDININGVAAYTGDGADASNWTDTIGSNDATKVGSPVAFTGQGISAFVDTWYDQSGNGNDATQSTTASQPKIIENGSLVTQDGKPSLAFDGEASTGDHLTITKPSQLSTDMSILTVINFIDPDGSDNVNDVFISQAGNRWWFYAADAGDNYQARSSDNNNTADSRVASSGLTVNTRRLFTVIRNNSSDSAQLRVNGSLVDDNTSGATLSITSSDFTLGRLGTGSRHTYGNAQEVIFFGRAIETDASELETDINNYYNIY